MIKAPITRQLSRSIYTQNEQGRIMKDFDELPKSIRIALTQTPDYHTQLKVSAAYKQGKKERHLLNLIKESKAKQELGQKSELTSELTFEDL